MTRSIPLLAAFALLAACGGGGGDEAESAQGELAFTVNREGWGEIWLMAADGSDRRRLTELEPPRNDAAGASGPAWSPDGSQLAFSAQVGTREEDQSLSEIYVVNADGSNRRRLTRNREYDGEPTWSPDGAQIGFVRASGLGTEDAVSGIFVMDADGGRQTRVTRARAPTFDGGPAWSPGGATIAFTRATFGEVSRAAVFTVAPFGGRPARVVSDGGEPAWSPDGARLALASYRDRFGDTCFHECSPSGEIYVANADGSGARRLTESEADDRSPAWSPDGHFIAFVSDASNRETHENEIYVMNEDGSDVRRITRNQVWDLEPRWRPR